MQSASEKVYCFEGYTLDLGRGCLRREDREVELRPKSFEVLRYLVENAGRLVSKDELIRAVWPNVVVTDESLTRCVSDVRLALQDHAQRIIKTVPRRGYLLAAQVSQPAVDARLVQSATATSLVATSALQLPDKPSIAVLPFEYLSNDREQEYLADGAQLSFLVLPFVNLSDNREEEYFADGLTDDLTTDLSQWKDSFVIARSTALAYKGKAVDAKSIGRDLRVAYVLEGSVRRVDSRVRVGVQLIETENGGHVWADRFDRELADTLDIQDEITKRIALALHYTMTDVASHRARNRRSNNLSARDLEARGDAAQYKPTSKATMAEARGFYERALEIDDQSIRAWGGLALVHVADVLARWSEAPAEQLQAAERAAARALECDSMSPYAHLARAAVLFARGKLEAALQEYGTVTELSGGWPVAYGRMGLLNALLGRPEETFRLVEKAIRLSPRDANLGEWYLDLGIASFMMDQLGEAILWLRRSAQVNPELGINSYALAAACSLDGRHEEARAALSESRRLNPTMTINKLRASPFSIHPVYLAWRQRFYEGLRAAGMPEE
jgi:TolB-like protein/Flp pilus assembly protein TadD